jgi:hypothetical protein
MKPFIMIMAITIGTGVGWGLSQSAPPDEAAAERAPAAAPVQSESAPAPNLLEEGPPASADTTLQFESETLRQATPADREVEELRFHQHTSRERFENTDDRGEVLLSFSGGNVDLVLRGTNGAEAPVARLD